MIHGVFGKLGSGKGLYVMDIIYHELMDGFRDVVCNVPIRVVPWVNGQGLAQIGLRAYLMEQLGPAGTEDYVDEILKRVKVIEDIDEGGDLYMWRRDGDTGEWFKLEVTKNDEKGRPERFDAEPIKTRHCAPVLVVTDEAWQFYQNNGGWARVPLLPFYARQQRKLRDEWYIITQHPTDVDSVLWNIAQDFHVCRNHGMERMGIFRQPAMFRVIVYLSNPSKGNAIRSHEFYKRLDKKLCQCYDTTAGVGIAGGLKGDSNQKKAGLHVGWLIAAVVVMVACLAFVPHLLGKGASAWIGKTVNPQKPANWSGLTNTPAVRPLPPPAATPSHWATPALSSEDQREEPPLTCVSYAITGNHVIVQLSDGEKYDETEVTKITKHAVTINGKQYKIKLNEPFTEYVPDRVDSPPIVSRPKPVNQADITVIGDSYGQRTAPPRLNGFGQMQQKGRSVEAPALPAY